MTTDARFQALANPTRRRLLSLVRDKGQPVGLLASNLGASQPAISQHLAVLRRAGLVSARPEGRRRLYRAEQSAILELQGFFEEYWSGSLDRLEGASVAMASERDAAS